MTLAPELAVRSLAPGWNRSKRRQVRSASRNTDFQSVLRLSRPKCPYRPQFIAVIDNCSTLAIVTHTKYGNCATATQR